MITIHHKNDLMGVVDVPADELWGTQTQRSLEHSCISAEKMPVLLIHALALTKRTMTKVNRDLKLLVEDKVRTIIQAVDEVLADKRHDGFPLVIWQTGLGTQSSMNVSEVLVNRTSELLGDVRGMRRKVRPSDDVNRSQSSNDTFLTAVHVTTLLAPHKSLIPRSNVLTKTLSNKSRAFADIIKVDRTHSQDVTPLTPGQEISGWVAMLGHNLRHVEDSLPYVAELALGGTTIGTGLNTHPEYARRVMDELRIITYVLFITAPSRFEALATYDALAHAHGTPKGLVALLMRTTNDIYWPASSPRCGIGEISIPEDESGNLIMPGKVNPTRCETLTMSCRQVMGNDVATSMGGVSGNFELDIYRPIVIRNFLQLVHLLADGIESFNEHCAMGIKPNRERIGRLLNESLVLVTTLNTHIGYDKAAEIAKKVHKEGLTLKAPTSALGYLTETEFGSWVCPELIVSSVWPGS